MSQDTPYTNLDKINRMQRELDKTKNIMIDNVQKALQKGEKIDNLVQKTEDLSIQSNIFQRRAKNIKCLMCKKNIKQIILVILVFIFIGILIYIFIKK